MLNLQSHPFDLVPSPRGLGRAAKWVATALLSLSMPGSRSTDSSTATKQRSFLLRYTLCAHTGTYTFPPPSATIYMACFPTGGDGDTLRESCFFFPENDGGGRRGRTQEAERDIWLIFFYDPRSFSVPRAPHSQPARNRSCVSFA